MSRNVRPKSSSTVSAVSFGLMMAALAGASCGGSAGPQTDKFVGAWTFTSGTLVPVCILPGVPNISLVDLNVTFTKVDATTIGLLFNASCNVQLKVNGASATAAPAQTCTLDLGGSLGVQTVNVTKWALTLSGDHIDNDIAVGVASGLCSASGKAVLVRGTSDAGTPRDGSARETGSGDAGGKDAADGGDGGTADASHAADAGAGAEAGMDAGSDAATEAATETSDAADAPAAEGG